MWSQSDIDRLRAAILALATGEAVQVVSYAGPPARSVTYHPADLEAMRRLLGEMQADVNAQAGKSAVSFVATSKGFRR